VLLAFMGVAAAAVLLLRNLFAVVMVSGIYSLLAASMLVLLDAVDVAFTEAAVGAGISTVLMLATLALTRPMERRQPHFHWTPVVVVAGVGLLFIYATFDMPKFGDPAAPIHHHVAPEFLARSVPETTIPNVVTSTLASYRGYDTLGETTVIFTAGIGVIILLGGRARRQAPPQPAPGTVPLPDVDDGGGEADYDGDAPSPEEADRA